MPERNNGPYVDQDFRELEVSAEELFEEAPCGYLSALPDGTIFKANKTLLGWLGYEKDELIGKKTFQQLLSIGGQMFYETHHAPLVKMQGFVSELNYEIVRKDNSRLSILVNEVQKKNDEGKPLFHWITVFDYSDRKKYENELLLAKKKAEAAMEAKALFLSTVTHEIRTPIHVVMAISDLLGKSNIDSYQAELISTLNFSAENLLQLVNDILDLSKIEAGRIKLEEQPFHPETLAHNIVNSLKPTAQKKGIDLIHEYSGDLKHSLLGDYLKIGRVLTNLLSNAIKFTDQGSVRLKIAAQPTAGGKIAVNFAVSDTGIGIPEEKQATIFEAFEQADDSVNNQYGGTGLGLSICKKILELYGAELFVKSKVNKGSIFYFTVYLDQAKAITQTSQTPSQQDSLSHIKVLLAEDNKASVLIATKYFQQWGMQYDIAENGKIALEMIKSNDYDLVLMDLKMPVMDGFTVIKELRALPGEKYLTLPILALSATPLVLSQTKMKEAGLSGLIPKPFKPSNLRDAISKMVHAKAPSILSVLTKEDETAPLSNSATVESEADLDLSRINEIFESDNPALLEYYHALLDDLNVITADFSNAFDQQDFKIYRNAVHKAGSFTRIFKAKRFEALMGKGKEIMKTQNVKKQASIRNQILAEIKAIISFIRKEMKTLEIEK